ncbi:MAG: ATP-dependent Clp protease ATP-binding subunit, partial [Acidobacteria bacterium]|nr:ATP-dependent Clp protease ATP-binding subunit [Acidobacteriota bacterium]
TSNLGATEIANKLHGRIGFGKEAAAPDERLEQKLKRIAIEAARRKFSPEFMNRIDKVIAFRVLTPSDLGQVLEIELQRVQHRLHQASGGNELVFHCSKEAKCFLLQDGLDLRYGARHLRRSVERHLVHPLAHLLATHQVDSGDLLVIDHPADTDQLLFIKNGRSARISSWIAKKKGNFSLPRENYTQRGKQGAGISAP